MTAGKKHRKTTVPTRSYHGLLRTKIRTRLKWPITSGTGFNAVAAAKATSPIFDERGRLQLGAFAVVAFTLGFVSAGAELLAEVTSSATSERKFSPGPED